MSNGTPSTQIIEPNAALVQATAALLAARVALYKVQPGHDLIRITDRALETLLSPSLVTTKVLVGDA